MNLTEPILLLVVLMAIVAVASVFFKGRMTCVTPVVFVGCAVITLIAGMGIKIREIVEGPFVYLDSSMQILTGAAFCYLMYKNGTFEYLFNRYGDAIRRLFLQRSTSVEDTEDLLQETFIKVYVNLHRYSADYTFGQWVYTIARNTHIDFERRRQEDLSIDDKFSAPAASTPSPEESLISMQQRTQIEHYIECLPSQYRQLFKMRFLEDYSYDEIAEKLHLPMGTVKTQIHRARERMCTLIREGEK